MSAGIDWADERWLVDDAVWGVIEALNALGVEERAVAVLGSGGTREVFVAGGARYVVSVKEA